MRSYATRFLVAGYVAVCSSNTPSARLAQPAPTRPSTAQTPYTLASGFPTAKGPAAVVYTPDVRRNSGEPREDVQSESDADFIHVVMSADTVMRETRIDAATPMRMEVVQKLETRLVGSSAASSAVWVKHVPARREPQLLGTEFCGVAVGAFRRNQLCGGCYVVLFRLVKAGGNKRLVAAWAVIPEGASDWR